MCTAGFPWTALEGFGTLHLFKHDKFLLALKNSCLKKIWWHFSSPHPQKKKRVSEWVTRFHHIWNCIYIKINYTAVHFKCLSLNQVNERCFPYQKANKPKHTTYTLHEFYLCSMLPPVHIFTLFVHVYPFGFHSKLRCTHTAFWLVTDGIIIWQFSVPESSKAQLAVVTRMHWVRLKRQEEALKQKSWGIIFCYWHFITVIQLEAIAIVFISSCENKWRGSTPKHLFWNQAGRSAWPPKVRTPSGNYRLLSTACYNFLYLFILLKWQSYWWN